MLLPQLTLIPFLFRIHTNSQMGSGSRRYQRPLPTRRQALGTPKLGVGSYRVHLGQVFVGHHAGQL